VGSKVRSGSRTVRVVVGSVLVVAMEMEEEEGRSVFTFTERS
jgi:hypothetical protein